jgi:peptidoglycan/xylan/chitin deacetylase (PgdA/CDA1 family)
VGFTPKSRSRSAAPARQVARRAGAAVVASLLLTVVFAAPGSAVNDPRGANRVFEAPDYAGDPAAPVVALTFDDGPHPEFTPKILDILKAKDVKATFFLVGREAERHPDLVRRIVAEGHIIGNHTWNHAHLQGLSEEQFSFEIDHTTEVLEAISGQDVVCTRPPYGDAKPDTVERLAAHGQASIVWSADSRDFDKPGPGPIVDHSLEGLRPGSIVLLHDGGGNRDQTIAALPQLIDAIRGRGYSIGPVCDSRPHRPEGYVDRVAGDAPESVHVVGWAKDPDSADGPTVRITVDGALAHEGPANGTRGDGHPGIDVTLPVAPGPHHVCLAVVNVGLGSDRDLGCYDATALEAPWFDRLGRYLGLLGTSERWEDAPPALASESLNELVEILVPAR